MCQSLTITSKSLVLERAIAASPLSTWVTRKPLASSSSAMTRSSIGSSSASSSVGRAPTSVIGIARRSRARSRRVTAALATRTTSLGPRQRRPRGSGRRRPRRTRRHLVGDEHELAAQVVAVLQRPAVDLAADACAASHGATTTSIGPVALELRLRAKPGDRGRPPRSRSPRTTGSGASSASPSSWITSAVGRTDDTRHIVSDHRD